MPHNSIEYEEDFYAWTVAQSRLLRAGEFSAIDAANIAEKIESMGRSDRRELKSRLVVLVMHQLKWQHQPGGRSRSWSATIDEQRLQIDGLLAEYYATSSRSDAREALSCDKRGRRFVAEAIAGGTLTLDPLRSGAAGTRALLSGDSSSASIKPAHKPAL